MTRSRDVADVQENIGGAVPPFTAGKNKIINGDFGVWQRGTSFAYTSTTIQYTADRWLVQCNLSSGTSTVSQQTFTPGSAPVAGYESQYFMRTVNSAGATAWEMQQRVEDVRTYAGQTVTISFWAKASSSITMSNVIIQNFGSGGSGGVSTTGTSQTIGTSWARYSTTINVPSVSGKTIGTNSFIQVYPMYVAGGGIASNTIEVWGVQLEAGNAATPFTTATGTIQGELAACQRYYFSIGTGTGRALFNASAFNSTSAFGLFRFPVVMRTAPTLEQVTGTNYFNLLGNGTTDAFDSIGAITDAYPSGCRLDITSGIAATQGYSYWVTFNNAAANVAFSAEL